MTKVSAKKLAAAAFALAAVVLPVSCQRKSSNDFSHVAQLNKTWTFNGDSITIDQVRGPSDRWIVGDTYEIRGTYKLASREKAALGAFVTTSSRHTEPPVSPGQTMEISKGEGQFRLRLHFWRDVADCPIGATCGPHVSLYPLPSGESFLSAYI